MRVVWNKEAHWMLIFLRMSLLSKIQGLIVLIIPTAAAGKRGTKRQVMVGGSSPLAAENSPCGGDLFDFITATDYLQMKQDHGEACLLGQHMMGGTGGKHQKPSGCVLTWSCPVSHVALGCFARRIPKRDRRSPTASSTSCAPSHQGRYVSWYYGGLPGLHSIHDFTSQVICELHSDCNNLDIMVTTSFNWFIISVLHHKPT